MKDCLIPRERLLHLANEARCLDQMFNFFLFIKFFLDDEIGSAQDTLEFELKVKCIKNSKNEQGSSVPNDMYINHNG